MYDSTGKLPEFQHNLIRPKSALDALYVNGNFDKCLSVQSDREHIVGQYCTVFLNVEPVPDEFLINGTKLKEPRMSKVEVPKNLYESLPTKDAGIGFCLPSSCSASDLRSAVAQRVGRNMIEPGKSVVTIADENHCFTNEKIASHSALDLPSGVFL